MAIGAALGFLLAFPLLGALRKIEHKLELAEFLLVNREPVILLCVVMLALAGACVARALDIMEGNWNIGLAAVFVLGLCLVLCKTKRTGKLGAFVHGTGFLLLVACGYLSSM